ncbi:target of Nesh-SH3-like [Sinocyclocheilus grahami]|uniref:target of Nesh-SH3-like n=1 Tax=Sinocyclocheilus grahami TaxID=75366 RepID=UPI0007ACFE4E|nr:PREDICTED: target of Nesh-SH3-like [Sinocyclocheilus grahami]
MNDCLEDGHYTIRYRERNRKWIYQTCPTSDTVIDNLKPNTPYEFGVRSNKDDHSGMWSKPVIHNTNMGDKNMQITYKQNRPIVKTVAGTHSSLFPLQPGKTINYYSLRIAPNVVKKTREFCHLLTLMSFQTRMTYFLL